MKQTFGALEQSVMDVIWRRDWATVREVVEQLRMRRRMAYTTIMTVMNRLTDHGILIRQPTSRNAFRYAARYSREEYSARASKQGIDELIRRYGDVAWAHFLDKLDRVPNEKLARLRRHLRQRRS